MSYVLDGYKFGTGSYGTTGGTISYSFATSNFQQANEQFQPYNYTSFLTGQFQTEVKAALAAWEAVANVHFVEVADSATANLRFGFVDFFPSHWGSTAQAGGVGGIAGQANVFLDNNPNVNSPAHVTDADVAFDQNEGWQIINGEILTGPGGTRFLSIAEHEIGHALGLDHDTADRSIMQPSLDPSYRGLEAVDIQGAKFIYGAAAVQPVAGSVAISDVTIVEGNSGSKDAVFTVARSNGTAAFNVNFATADGTATAADGDYVAKALTTLQFAAGEMSKTISIAIKGDTKVEGNETFSVNLSSATNGATISDSQGVGTITNDDAAPVAGSVAISDVTIVEGNSGSKDAVFTVARSNGTAAFNVNFATADGTATAADGDYVAKALTTLQFAAGEMSKTISIAIKGDTKVEGNETFSVNLSSATNGATISDSQGVGTITNDDAAPVAGSVAISDVTIVEGNSGSKDAVFTVARSNGTAAFNVNFATADGTATAADGDYVAKALTTLQFAAGEMSKTISIAINGDTKVEGNETFSVNLSSATNGATISDSQGVGTITNDDAAPVNHAPVVTAHDVSVGAHQSIAASSLFVAHDAEGDNTITQYAFWDGGNGGGHFTVNGVTQASGQWIYANASDLASVKYVGGATAGSESLYVDAFDGKAWSPYDGLTATTTGGAVVANDLNGDGKADVLWQGEDGQSYAYLMNGLSVANSGFIGNNHDATWHVVGSGDLNGDGKADVLWQNGSGEAYAFLMDGTSVVGSGYVGNNHDATWHVKELADLNGDGKSDLIWQGEDGQSYAYMMDGMSVVGSGFIGNNHDASWRIVGAGDLNGDGNSDILWQNGSGQAYAFLMDGISVVGSGYIGHNTDTYWQVKGSGDFNGDGKADVLWQGQGGEAYAFLMDGLSVTGSDYIGNNHDTSWEVKGALDLNGDGKSDVLWQNDSGEAYAFMMDGLSVVDTGYVGNNHDSAWHVIV